MSLRDDARQDARDFIGDADAGFAHPITVKDPKGREATVNGITSHISHDINPETGLAIANRHASAALSKRDLNDAGLDMPIGVYDTTIKPWLVSFESMDGSVETWKVKQAFPDETLGIVTCSLEAYQ